MYQVVGKIVHSNKVVGLMVYSYTDKKLIRATLKDCVDEVRNNNISNLTINNGTLVVTDGSFSKLPVYDVNGVAKSTNLPVILERVTSNDKIVGYTLIDKGVYKKCKSDALFKSYSEFYNAKVVTKDNTTFLSAKKGTFKELKLSTAVQSQSKSGGIPVAKSADNEYVCKPEDFEIKDGCIVRYLGKDRETIEIPESVTEIETDSFAGTKVNNLYIHNLRKLWFNAFSDLHPRGYLIFDDSMPPENYVFNSDMGGFYLSDVLGYKLKKTGKQPKCKIVDGNILSADGKTLVLALWEYANEGESDYVEVPNGVQVVGEAAFDRVSYDEDEDDIKFTVVFPDSVTSILTDRWNCVMDTVVANRGTYAEQYAKENNIKFVTRSEFFADTK